MVSRSEVYNALDSERDYQEMRKARDNGAEVHSVDEFLLYIVEYTNQAVHVASTTWGPSAKDKTLDAIRKIAALGVACMEQHGAPKRALVA